jgi:hypothetical protein
MSTVLFHPSLLEGTNIYEMSLNVPSQHLAPLLRRPAGPRTPHIVLMMLVRDFITVLSTPPQGYHYGI